MPHRLARLEKYIAERDTWGPPRRTWINVLVPRPWLPTLAFMVGIAILIGGPKRFSGPSFAAPRFLAPWWVWGCVFIGMGVLQLIPMTPGWEWVVRYVSALPFFTLATAIGCSVPLNSTVAFTGVAVYGWVAAVHLRIAVLRRDAAREARALLPPKERRWRRRA